MEQIKEYKHDVFTIDDIVSEEEAQKIINYLEYLADNDILKWNQISFYESWAMGFWKFDPKLVSFGLPIDYFAKLKERIKSASEKALGQPLVEVSYHAQKWETGAHAGFHSDNSKDGKPTAFERSKFAAFLYLNDSFEGGLLNFEHHPITIKPKIGMLAVFDGGHGNEHEVTVVESGVRYTIGSFWDKEGMVYSEERIKEMEDELKGTRSEQDEMYKEWNADKEKGIILTPYGKVQKDV